MSNVDHIEEIVTYYSACLLRVAFNILGNISDAEDTVQDVFLKLYQKKPHFADKEHEKAWLLRVTINSAKNRLRNRKGVYPLEQSYPFAQYIEDDARIVAETVQALDEKYRIVIHLHYYEGFTIREIAALLRIPASTAGTRLERAKAKLKHILKTEDLL